MSLSPSYLATKVFSHVIYYFFWKSTYKDKAKLGLSLANLIEARASVAVDVIANKAKRDLVSLS